MATAHLPPHVLLSRSFIRSAVKAPLRQVQITTPQTDFGNMLEALQTKENARLKPGVLIYLTE
ncbi:hypothetical protein ABLE91_09350 [Aquabacter sp. CN5-332]|uniref:hypothetical protein n=1 Tax=Aquabacter sp. CN5-332 TaxID=3156608 RepID=UPI0032B5D59A